VKDAESGKGDAVYFAYGTLLDVGHMREFCPSAEPLGVMRLPGYRLGFARCGPDPSVGGCTLLEDEGNTLYGVLYTLSGEDLASLDKASGTDRGLWASRSVVLRDESDREFPANTYVIPNPAGDYHPPPSYTERILRGARAWSLPHDYLRQLEEIVRTAETGC
jgi:hypothetical protein